VVWGAVPTTTDESFGNKKFPTVGTYNERIHATRLFNEYLKDLSEKNNILMVSIFDELLNKNNLPEEEYFMDGTHLSQKAMPLALKKIQMIFPELS
jgi:lysophospholipase L1-like esterase